ncbi:MAG TPA: FAD-binding protein [Actinomycetota bacterium]|jgi:glycolate oxidase FAD binding subunit
MDLIHPASKPDLVEAVRDANATGRRILAIGGRQHVDKGNPAEVDAELWTTQLDRVVSYEPAEMIAVVEAGIRIGTLNRILAEGGQEWPSDAPEEATVGGVIACAATSPRRMRVGPIRDTVLEAEVVTGDGRLVRSGARTVKNVTGYDVHRLVAGSLGTLGVLAQVALKVRPLPRSRRTLRFAGGFDLATELLRHVPGAAGVIVGPGRVELRLEGWAEEVDELDEMARARAIPETSDGEGPFPSEAPWDERPVVAEVAVPPSRLPEVASGNAWGALAGVGIAWMGLDGSPAELARLRERVSSAGGIAPVVKGPGGLGEAPLGAPDVHRRLKRAFDPNGILAPGRGWSG